jgi:hypothetical protein
LEHVRSVPVPAIVSASVEDLGLLMGVFDVVVLASVGPAKVAARTNVGEPTVEPGGSGGT